MSFDPRCVILVMALLATAMLGCSSSEGPPRVAVDGRVVVDGKPLSRGSIEFIPVEGTVGPKAAAEIVNGVYKMPKKAGPVVGTLRVEINAIQQPGFALDDPVAHAEHAVTTREINEVNRIPPEYNERSTLIRTISEDGPNTFNFTIKTGERS